MADERIIYHLQYPSHVAQQTSRSLPSRIQGNRFDLEILAHSQGRFAMLESLSCALKESVFILLFKISVQRKKYRHCRKISPPLWITPAIAGVCSLTFLMTYKLRFYLCQLLRYKIRTSKMKLLVMLIIHSCCSFSLQLQPSHTYMKAQN